MIKDIIFYIVVFTAGFLMLLAPNYYVVGIAVCMWIWILRTLIIREKKIREWKPKEYPPNIWDICKEKVEDGPTPCWWPHCDCDGKPPSPLT